MAVKITLIAKLVGPPKGVSNIFMTMKLSILSGIKHITIISCYAPIMTNPDELEVKFYRL